MIRILFILAHEGHHDVVSWLEQIGSLHFVFLHFPIALINMLVISELLWLWLKKPIFDDASRFLLASTAILSLPTALFGLLFSYSTSYEGTLATFFWWHMWLGFATSFLALILAFMREKPGYYLGLLLLFLCVNIGSFFGGALTFTPLIL